MKIVGWLGAFFFAICAIPQAYECWQRGNAEGISIWFLMAWLAGEVLMLTYVLNQDDKEKALWPLIANYVFNLMSLLVILYYKFFPVL